MSNQANKPDDPLSQMLAALPKDVQPERDLWQGIQAEIGKTPIVTDSAPVVHFSSTRWFQMAAGVLLVLATSLTTFVLTRSSMEKDAAVQVAQQPVPTATAPLNAMPVSFGTEALGADYMKARSELDASFEARMKTLPPSTRAKLERNLADLRHAANEISATLAENPSDPLLQDLLMSTYQRELQLLADVSEVPVSHPVRTDL
ncbi:hypothetical protein GCM10011487_07560 [Steroidobacter agaridevorans]|uniref:Uncharacterized protein n=1 Tax=Steroidobacter agaridevorans TaxID=2695856 RepID=A0A829Y7I3_9GAMM|nr:hypothetical protein [Steroidobacter agaridevorans]GFE78756.1 hypothetical protein GCM10011487_07560 [Steroidobacter agaridevorans]GFE89311.1 hypothetical protein GCM10011488_42650 [Steroidobacter agaridevorans]